MCAQQTNRRKDPVPRRYSSATGRSLRASRSGLAPLEMVLGLPLVLLLFALMVNAGFTGMWKLRLLGASREVAWRSRDPRSNNLPDPKYQSTFWTQPEHPTETPLTTGTSSTNPLSIEDLGSAAAVRADVGTLTVDKDLLDPKRGVFQGSSDVSRQFPLLPDSLQVLHGSPTHQLTDNCFPFWNTHLASNVGRRTKILYGEWVDNPFFKRADTAFANPPGQSNRGIAHIEYGSDWQGYESAVESTNNALFNDNLLPLGSFSVKHSNPPKYTEGRYHDPEAYQWIYRGLLPNPPGFMPGIREFISSDASSVWDKHVEPHVMKIDDDQLLLCEQEDGPKETEHNLPYALAGSYISFFNDAIGLVQDYINELNQQLQQAQMDLEVAQQAKNKIAIASLKTTIAGYQAEIKTATKELERRKQILDPVIQQLQTYQNDF